MFTVAACLMDLTEAVDNSPVNKAVDQKQVVDEHLPRDLSGGNLVEKRPLEVRIFETKNPRLAFVVAVMYVNVHGSFWQ